MSEQPVDNRTAKVKAFETAASHEADIAIDDLTDDEYDNLWKVLQMVAGRSGHVDLDLTVMCEWSEWGVAISREHFLSFIDDVVCGLDHFKTRLAAYIERQ